MATSLATPDFSRIGDALQKINDCYTVTKVYVVLVHVNKAILKLSKNINFLGLSLK